MWKTEQDCSEGRILSIAAALAADLRAGDRVLLEGAMGVGKTTFACAMLGSLGIKNINGSPTFPIVHEYKCAVGVATKVVVKGSVGVIRHMDFYRIKSEMEIEDAGLHEHFSDGGSLIVTEWLSLWPKFESAVLKSGRIWRVNFLFAEGVPGARGVQVLAGA